MASKSSTEIDKKVLRFFSAIADETRLKMLKALVAGPKTVNEVYDVIGRESMTLSAVSHQLKYLEQVGVVVFEKRGREKLFRPSQEFCWCILRDAYDHFEKSGKSTGCAACQKAMAKGG
ncbi:MAG: winged helix-turn-helix transcriptional regulator [Candidatus Diapherotrites archaeon]|uniref:Winged helix-turn-helix transcriptional regulator n=1 Tax=Candidatus Iainarchaeum sp. TaxID=3101447 RepID=A0A8T4L3F3_9ARCH|nr:winged helix-turn-helix transcriptional regulator [Candidatus Diapherotrites archaeon]